MLRARKFAFCGVCKLNCVFLSNFLYIFKLWYMFVPETFKLWPKESFHASYELARGLSKRGTLGERLLLPVPLTPLDAASRNRIEPSVLSVLIFATLQPSSGLGCLTV